jgi:hypothetical protein
VPITTSGLFRSTLSCFWREAAPITRTAYSLVYLFSFANYSYIWTASYRVGVTTSARMYPTATALKYRCRMGSRNAAVLPEPVIELATTSRPDMITGMASC